MIQGLIESLTRAVEGTGGVAVAAAFAWGILSVILSPCHMVSIPLIVGFVGKQGTISTRRAFVISTVFSFGILCSIAAVGGITVAMGRVIGDLGSWTNYIVAGIFFLFGLVLLDIIKLPWSGPGQIDVKTKGLLAALLLGLVFGIATGPCTFAFMAPLLGATFDVASAEVGLAVLLIVMYGIGHCLVIVVAGTSTEMVQKYMKWNETSKATAVLRKTCGVLIILGGGYLIYSA